MSERVITLSQEEVERMLKSGEMKIISTPGDIKEAEPCSNTVKLERAKEIFGEDFLGPEAVKIAFGIDLKSEFIPPIPFSEEELIRAKELNQFLILRVNKAADGKDMTMEGMEQLLRDTFRSAGKGKILFNSNWYKNTEDFFKKDTPLPRWALVSKEILPNSTNKNPLEQTQQLADYIRDEVFSSMQLPQVYEEAIREFESKRDYIKSLIDAASGKNNRQEGSRKLAALKLNQLARHSPVEALYDMLLTTQNTQSISANKDQRFLETTFTWTSCLSSNGALVLLGNIDLDGAGVADWYLDSSFPSVGVCLSR